MEALYNGHEPWKGSGETDAPKQRPRLDVVIQGHCYEQEKGGRGNGQGRGWGELGRLKNTDREENISTDRGRLDVPGRIQDPKP